MKNCRLALAASATVIVLAADATFAQQNPDGKLPIGQAADPYLFLIRDPFVHKELQLAPSQLESLQALNDEMDSRLWTTRNRRPKESAAITQELIETSRERANAILTGDQQQRLQQIRWQVLGTRSLLQDDVISQLNLSPDQQTSIRGHIDDTRREVAELEEQARAGKPLAPLEAKNRQLRIDEQKQILAALERDQRSRWISMFGRQVDLQQLGRVKFKAPRIHGEGEWINSSPLNLEQLKGKVVALHFWTFGCINCKHNYPSYKNWQRQFAGEDLVILGVHTPEGQHEYDVPSVRESAAKHELTFPILIDNEQKNWNAWGNSMWPSVYLIDKQGYVRYWWIGELNWQGADGEEKLTRRISELLSE